MSSRLFLFAFSRNGSRLSSARAFLRDPKVRSRPNLHVMLNSTATRILFKRQGNQKVVSGVEFVYNNRAYRVNVSKEVVLSAGAINSPQLLLLSGIGPRKELNRVGIEQIHELPGVGKNLHNHVTFYLNFLLRKHRAVNDLDWASALDYFLFRNGPMSSTGMSQLTARINSKYADPSGSFPDLQIFFAGYLANCAKSGQINDPEDLKNPDKPRELTMSPVVLHPKSKGYLTLKSRNPMEPPLMYANYLTDPEDVKTLIEGIRVTQRLANTTVLRQKYGIELEKDEYGDCGKKYRYNSDDFWECAIRLYTGPENHQAGSCKMGPEWDRMAVVNPRLEVRGVNGLRVMDASVMPSVVSGNTHATIVMIAERGADFIKNTWLRGALQNRGGFMNAPSKRDSTLGYHYGPGLFSASSGEQDPTHYDFHTHHFPHSKVFHQPHQSFPNDFGHADATDVDYFVDDLHFHQEYDITTKAEEE